MIDIFGKNVWFTIITLVTVVVGIYLAKQYFSREGFYGASNMLYCRKCGRDKWMSQHDCYNCVNCGWCITQDGTGECSLGRPNGPLFKECRSWFYRGSCVWGPECSHTGPIYITHSVKKPFPWYRRWFWLNK